MTHHPERHALLNFMARREQDSTCQHKFEFDIVRSFENGHGEIHHCVKCGELMSPDQEEEEEYGNV